MKSIHPFTKKEAEEFLNKLNSQFGIEEIPGRLVKKGGERIFLYQGDYSDKEIQTIEGIAEIERLGAYIGKIFNPTGEARLSIEGTQIFKDQINKNIIEIDSYQAQAWMEGDELQIKPDITGIVVIKFCKDMLGCGKASAEKVTNYIPKVRRLKKKEGV
ncbi:MAG: hypothetical protein ABEI74_02795 [Candidatus Pacearchaeota archaeon]